VPTRSIILRVVLVIAIAVALVIGLRWVGNLNSLESQDNNDVVRRVNCANHGGEGCPSATPRATAVGTERGMVFGCSRKSGDWRECTYQLSGRCQTRREDCFERDQAFCFPVNIHGANRKSDEENMLLCTPTETECAEWHQERDRAGLAVGSCRLTRIDEYPRPMTYEEMRHRKRCASQGGDGCP
jgi:hypothetical protein